MVVYEILHLLFKTDSNGYTCFASIVVFYNDITRLTRASWYFGVDTWLCTSPSTSSVKPILNCLAPSLLFTHSCLIAHKGLLLPALHCSLRQVLALYRAVHGVLPARHIVRENDGTTGIWAEKNSK